MSLSEILISLALVVLLTSVTLGSASTIKRALEKTRRIIDIRENSVEEIISEMEE